MLNEEPAPDCAHRPMTFGLGQRTTWFVTIGHPTLTGKLIA